MVTKRYGGLHEDNATLYKEWYRSTSKRFIKPPSSISRAAPRNSDRCRLPTASALSNQADKSQITLRSVLIDKPKFLKATHHAEKQKNCSSEVHGGGLEPVKLARNPASSCPKPCASLKNAPRILALRGKKQSLVRDEPCPQKLPGSRL